MLRTCAGKDGFSTRDGWRDPQSTAAPVNLWSDCSAITDALLEAGIQRAIPLCEADPAWAAWRDIPMTVLGGGQKDCIEHELRRQVRERRAAAQRDLTDVAAISLACAAADLDQWGPALHSICVPANPLLVTAHAPSDSSASAFWGALLRGGLGGRDDAPLTRGTVSILRSTSPQAHPCRRTRRTILTTRSRVWRPPSERSDP